ncbi:MAG: glycosyl transferase [SAR86 cluster bacterium]|uniref:Glycosyl transferase n=1 Tax=SAR86 cluster bacterium TaxID=2030880 RepID=A0A2A5CBG1_9GAMM|nr:MAG: glycosyl transferase [SAR86 cluster bacterium]
MTKNKILVTASTFPRWLGDTDPPFIYYLCLGLQKYEVHILAPHCKGCPEKEVLKGLHIHRYRYAPQSMEVLAYDGGLLRKIKSRPLYALLLPFFIGGQWLAIRRLQNKHKFALIHAHWIIPQGLVAALSPCKYLLTSHGGDLYALKGKFLTSIKKWILKKAARVTVVSHAMVSECVKLGLRESDVTVQPMGVDTTDLFVAPENHDSAARNGILCVGRLVEKKGISVLIEALAVLRAIEIKPKLTIIGDGPEAENLKRLVSEKKLGAQVIFLGAIRNTDLPAYYQQASIFVLPSIISKDGDQEGLGLVSVEAMACGCPVIASALPAVKDVVSHEKDGLLVEPGSASAFAKAIHRLLEDKNLRNLLAEAGLQRASYFDWKKVSARYQDIIEQLISK